MSIFEIYKKEVKLPLRNGKEITLELRPLSGRFLPKLFSVASKFSADEKDQMKLFEDEKSISDLHSIVLETLVKSYPTEDRAVLEDFASQNLFKLIEGVIEVNIGKQE